LKINCNNSVGAGFPRPIALITDAGGENPTLLLDYLLKDHKRTVKFKAPLCGGENAIMFFAWFGVMTSRRLSLCVET
jgi:hypothetical protein